ncbi:MAG: hypothetical protein WCG98_04760 [bacterium]
MEKRKVLLFFGNADMEHAMKMGFEDTEFICEVVAHHFELMGKVTEPDVLAIFLDETISDAGDFGGRKTQTYQNTATLVLDDLQEIGSEVKVILVSTWHESDYANNEKRLFVAFKSTQTFSNGNWQNLMKRLRAL